MVTLPDLPLWMTVVALAVTLANLALAVVVMALRLRREGVHAHKIATDSSLIVAIVVMGITTVWALGVVNTVDFQILSLFGRALMMVFLTIALFRIVK